MTIKKEESLTNFEFWGGAKDTIKYLTDAELDMLEMMLEDCHPEGMDETAINDYFWFDRDDVAWQVGFDNFEDLVEHRKDK